jgi:uncharacterized protein (TIGR03437 family)
LLVSGAVAQNTCANFPPNFVPFSSVAYVTAANSVGDHLVVGPLAGGVGSLGNVPPPASTNQTFCDAQVQLAPQQFYPNVYVPSMAERSGNFSAFSGLLVDPANNQPYPGGIIPSNQLGAVFAWRIGAAQATSTSRGWSPTGSMSTGRAFHTATLLPNGKVLVVGSSNTADIYDPATGTFTPTSRTLFVHDLEFTATLLNDGRVLIVGGETPSSAELYDPPSGMFVATGGTVAPHNQDLTATLLADGRVLVAGGLDPSKTLSTAAAGTAAAEIYDPKTGTFTQTGSLSADRFFHTATLLQDGRVLVAGGEQGTYQARTLHDLRSAEIFDPATGQFSSTGAMQFPRVQHFAILLASGKVLVGCSGFNSQFAESAELFDPATGTFALTGSMSAPRNFGATATLLSSGQVLVAGGDLTVTATGSTSTNSADLYNPVTGAFSPTGSMVSTRRDHTATALFDGRVLVTGGYANVIGGGTPLNSAELYTPVIQGLVTSQTGLTFRAAQGGGLAPPQNVAVLSNTDTIPWTLSTRTYSGGSWLTATPASATSGPTTAPVTLTIIADATGLAAQDYYGVVTLTPADGQHPPVSIAVVLTIVPAGAAAPPAVTPSGLVFLTTHGINAKPQAFAISNLTSRALTFTGVATATPSFFDFAPKTGTINAGQTLSITVTPASTNLAAGVYRGSIKLTFGDGSAQTVDVLLVTSATAGKSAVRAAASCTPTKLLPVLNSIGTGFTTPLAWPTSLIVQVVDDCGTSINAGSVTASFTNGDVPISLLAIGGGTWSATWVPVHNAAGAGVRADAQVPNPLLNGTVQVSGQVALNPKVPIVATGGVVSSGDYTSSPALGLLASIFGTALADGNLGNSSLPLPQQLGSTSVAVSRIQLPLLYVSDSQVNVFIPYELAVNAPHQLIVQRGNAISVPVPISIFSAQPAILATAGNGLGQGHVYKIDAQGNQILADANAPAKAGDVLVIYTVGLGPVTPAVKSGDPASFSVLSRANATVGVTIGGQPALVQFAGLTPGFSGLYQVNTVVPDGVTAGIQVPVLVSVAGSASSTAIYMAIQ